MYMKCFFNCIARLLCASVCGQCQPQTRKYGLDAPLPAHHHRRVPAIRQLESSNLSLKVRTTSSMFHLMLQSAGFTANAISASVPLAGLGTWSITVVLLLCGV